MKLIIHTAYTNEHRIPVSSLAEAKRKWINYRDDPIKYMMASEMRGRCGDVVDDDDKMVARISYNGRIWDRNGMELRA